TCGSALRCRRAIRGSYTRGNRLRWRADGRHNFEWRIFHAIHAEHVLSFHGHRDRGRQPTAASGPDAGGSIGGSEFEKIWRNSLQDQRMASMRTVWKIVSAGLVTIGFASFLFAISMHGWTSLPTVPRPDEGRIYPLNNHGALRYMNHKEKLLQEGAFCLFGVCLVAAGLIENFVDPFERKKTVRPLRPPPPWKWQK